MAVGPKAINAEAPGNAAIYPSTPDQSGHRKTDGKRNREARQRVVLDSLRDGADRPIALFAQLLGDFASAFLSLLRPLLAELGQIFYRVRRLIDDATQFLDRLGRLAEARRHPVAA